MNLVQNTSTLNSRLSVGTVGSHEVHHRKTNKLQADEELLSASSILINDGTDAASKVTQQRV